MTQGSRFQFTNRTCFQINRTSKKNYKNIDIFVFIYGVKTVDPVVSLPSSISWALLISDSGNSWPTSRLIAPSLTFEKLICHQLTVSRLEMWENTVGLVTFRDPFAASIPISNGGTLPLALPKLIIIPRGFKQSKDP